MRKCFSPTHPVPLEADELEQPHDPGREEGDEEVEGADAEADAALEVALVVVRRGLPVALVEGVPALAEGLEAGAHLEARLDEGHERLVLAEGEARLQRREEHSTLGVCLVQALFMRFSFRAKRQHVQGIPSGLGT